MASAKNTQRSRLWWRPTAATPGEITAPSTGVAKTTNPKRVDPRMVRGQVTDTPYHAPIVRPAAASMATAKKAGQMVGGAAQSAVSGVSNYLAGPNPAPLGPAPAPVPTMAPAPIAPAPVAQLPVSPAVADPYADLPPEVAALLRSQDQGAQAQSGALSGYYNQQVKGAQDFANQYGSTLTGLANLGGVDVTPNAPAGVSGPVGGLGDMFSKTGQRILGSEGFNAANAASLLPGFLRQAGGEAQQGLKSATETAKGKTIADYLDNAAKTLQAQLEQQGLDTRQAAQIASSEKIAAQQQAVAATNNQMDFLSNLLNAQIRSGDNAAANQTRTAIANLNAQAADIRSQRTADTSLTTAGMRAATSANAQKATSGKGYQKLKTDWSKGVRKMLQGERISTGTTTAKNAQGQTTRTPQYGYAGGAGVEDVFQQAIAAGLKPIDAFKLINANARGLTMVDDQGQTVPMAPLDSLDLYNALEPLVGSERARTIAARTTKVDPMVYATGDYSG